jgi:16S rRNA (cytosine967-C5)-methyltransferase
VNAVLRKMVALRGEIVAEADWRSQPVVPLMDGRSLVLLADIFPEDSTERLAMITSHPVEAVRRWVHARSIESAHRLAWHSFVNAPTILMHRGRGDMVLPEGCTAHREKGFAVYGGASEELAGLLERDGNWRVQDPGSAVAIRETRHQVGEPKFIVDLCAGSGTKTSQLLDAFPNAQIVACDPDQRRFAMLRVRFNAEPRVRLVPNEEMIELAGKADLVLIDVPCSNSGTLARRIEAKYRLDGDHLLSLVKLQRQIMIDALRLRKTGAPILYSTCSVEPMENEDQTAWMQKYNNVRTVLSGGHTPNGLPGEGPEVYRDGGYFAVWR